MRVGEELDLDMPRPLEVPLEEDGVVVECARCFAARRGDRVVEFVRRSHDPHAAATAACGGLDEERVADLVGRSRRQHGDACALRGLLRGELVASSAERGWRRANPRQARREHGVGELGALGQKAVAGMNRVCLALARRPHVLGRVEVRRDLDRLIGGARMQRSRVVGCGNRHRRDSLVPAGAEDPQRDLPTVRHK